MTNSHRNAILSYYLLTASQHSIFFRGLIIVDLIRRGISEPNTGLLMGVVFISTLLTEIPSGYLADRIGRKRTLQAGLLLLIGFSILMVFADGMAVHSSLFIVWGFAKSLISGADKSLLYDFLRSIRASHLYNRIEARATITGSLALSSAMLAGAGLQLLSWNSLYLAYGIVLCLGLFASRSLPEINEASFQEKGLKARKTNERYFGQSSLFLYSLSGIAIISGVMTSYYTYFQQIASSQGLSPMSISVLYGVSELMGAFTLWRMFNRNTQAVAVRNTVLAFILTACISFALLAFNDYLACIGFVVLIALTPTFDVSLICWLQDKIPSARRATWFSISSAMNAVTIAMVTSGIGFALQHSSLMAIAAIMNVLVFTAIAVFLFSVFPRSQGLVQIGTNQNTI